MDLPPGGGHLTPFHSKGTTRATCGDSRRCEVHQTLPDFAGVDAEFFVKKATGQVVDQHRAVTGSCEEETESSE